LWRLLHVWVQMAQACPNRDVL